MFFVYFYNAYHEVVGVAFFDLMDFAWGCFCSFGCCLLFRGMAKTNLLCRMF